MILSATERQAYLLFEKVLYYLDDNYKTLIKKGKYRPTKTSIKLTNGSIIHCLPTGASGLGIRGYTVDLLIIDDIQFIGKMEKILARVGEPVICTDEYLIENGWKP